MPDPPSAPGARRGKATGTTTGTPAAAPSVPCTALLYCRVSTEEQAREGLSLEAQRARTRRYAFQRGWVIGAEYADVLSGTRADRPQYRALLAGARALRSQARPVAVVVQWLDRFGRSVFERARCADELRSLRVPIHSVMEGGEIPELVANLLAAVAQEEVRRFAERTAEVRRHVIASGWYFPCRVPWGYRWRKSTVDERALGAPREVLEIDPGRAPFAREAWRRAAAGASSRATRQWMEALPAATRDDRKWDYRALRRMLTAPVYIGRPMLGDADVLARPPARWPPLIGEATWQAVQERLAQEPDRRRGPQRRYLLSGFLRCDRCGHGMTGGGRTDQMDAYRCGQRGGSRSTLVSLCSSAVLGPVLDALVLAQIRSLVEALGSLDPEQDARVRDAWQRRRGGVDVAARDLSAREAQDQWTDAATRFIDGVISPDEYGRRRDAAQAVLAAASSVRLGRPLAAVLPDIDELMGAARTWSSILAGTDVAGQREIIARLVHQIVPIRVAHARYTATLSWTALGEALDECVPPAARQLDRVLGAYRDVVFFHPGGSEGRLSATSRRRRTRDLPQLRALPQAAFDVLPVRDRAVLELYCGRRDDAPHSWGQLMERFSLSRCRVGQILRRGIVQLLGLEAAPRAWPVLTCATCGMMFSRKARDVRAPRDYACGGAVCAQALRSHTQRARGRPHATELRALPPEAYADLPERDRDILTRYYGVAGQREHTLSELSSRFRASRTSVLESIRRSVGAVLATHVDPIPRATERVAGSPN